MLCWCLTLRLVNCAACGFSSSLPARPMMDVTAAHLNLHGQGPRRLEVKLRWERAVCWEWISSPTAWLWRGRNWFGTDARLLLLRRASAAVFRKSSEGWKWLSLRRHRARISPWAALISEIRAPCSPPPAVKAFLVWVRDWSGGSEEARWDQFSFFGSMKMTQRQKQMMSSDGTKQSRQRVTSSDNCHTPVV